ncbi:hypothetical protein M5C72_08555 [Companilactobacillus allii]|uniref:Uncharacterized protein n=1 Tax=Companilactobacillus allii TaxID=1847728 RepID=A0A1P8Q5L5_9LACO|nr:hypothetical protein [Companilactobacillus allii]APX73131.1 hypothetical protein BTM29_11455 [Companilactobacillus allii]USQ67933.1 hypothetical protein M5C72_08555 [Companilactobacillus allii]
MNNIVELVQKVEARYGSVTKAPDDNAQLMITRDYWRKHADPYASFERIDHKNDIPKIQNMLDSGYPKQYIADEMFTSVRTLQNLELSGKVSDKKWKKNKLKLVHNKVFVLYHYGSFYAKGTVEEIAKEKNLKINTVYQLCHSPKLKFWDRQEIGDKSEWKKI